MPRWHCQHFRRHIMLVVDYTHSVRILLQTVGQLGKMVQHYRTALVHILLLGQTIQIISMYLVMLVFNIGPYQVVEHIRLKYGERMEEMVMLVIRQYPLVVEVLG